MNDRIFITQSDHERLTSLVEGLRSSASGRGDLAKLEKELDRAEIVDDGPGLPADVVAMNSEVKVMDADSGEIRDYRLVYPSQARAGNSLSILAPLGTAILGYRVGSLIRWQVPMGIRRLRILDVRPPGNGAGRSPDPPAAA